MTAHARHRGLVLAAILVGYLLVLIDVSILMVALPRIHHDLGFSATSLSWAQNAYTLTFGGLLLLGARAGDLLGRRRVFAAGITYGVRDRLPGRGRRAVAAVDDRGPGDPGHGRGAPGALDTGVAVHELS